MSNLTSVIEQIKQLTDAERQQLVDYLQSEQAKSEPPKPKKRVIGLHEHLGKGWMADDFDDELPDSFWLGEDE